VVSKSKKTRLLMQTAGISAGTDIFRVGQLKPWPSIVHGPSSYASVWDQFWVPCPFPVAIVHSQRVVSIGFCSTFPQILSTLWMPVCLTCIWPWSESTKNKRLTV
jgi:hypothetical protein